MRVVGSGKAAVVCLLALAVGAVACSGQAACDKLSGPLTIQRDEWGVPHVRAKTLADAAYGQGYAQAQDRLLQMDLLRRTAKGQRAELLGEAELETDKLVRTLGLVGAAEAALAVLDADSLCWMNAYAAGVNRYLADMQAGVNGAKRPADLQALDPAYVPPPWTAIDVVIVATAATFSLSSNLVSDLVLTASRLLLGDALYSKLVQFAPLADAYTLRDPAADGGITPLAMPTVDKASAARALASFAKTVQNLQNHLGPYASNNWAVAKQKTARGFAFLGSDPHGSINIPSSFHEIHLLVDHPQINAYGIAVAGAPMVHIGHNGRAAWAFTNYGADVGDLYQEVLDPNNRNYVLRNGQRLAIESREEIILVRPANQPVAAAKPQRLIVQTIPGHGPILTEVLPQPLPVIFNGKLISYRWLGYTGSQVARALGNLIKVDDWASYVANAQFWDVGAQNTVYANVQGQVGYYATGLFPARPWTKDGLSPIEPLPGDGAAEWSGFNVFTHIRELFQPAWGFVASANGDPSGFTADNDPFAPEYLGYVYDMGFRTARIKSQLAANNSIDWAAMQQLQTDVYVGLAELLTPRLLAATARQNTQVTELALLPLIAILSDWDYRASLTSAGAAIFHQTVIRLLSDYMADPVVGPLRPLLLGDAQFGLRALAKAIASQDGEFFPDGVDAAIVAALAAAQADLAAFFATTDVTQWQWGQLHVRQLKHPLGGSFNRGPVPSPGGFAVVNRSDIHYLTETGPATLPYNIVDGPDMRFLVELEDGVWTTKIILPHGSSGDPDSAHYDDQFALWVGGQYRQAHYRSADVDRAAKSTLTLQ